MLSCIMRAYQTTLSPQTRTKTCASEVFLTRLLVPQQFLCLRKTQSSVAYILMSEPKEIKPAMVIAQMTAGRAERRRRADDVLYIAARRARPTVGSTPSLSTSPQAL